jgi:hypothetical protein
VYVRYRNPWRRKKEFASGRRNFHPLSYPSKSYVYIITKFFINFTTYQPDADKGREAWYGADLQAPEDPE